MKPLEFIKTWSINTLFPRLCVGCGIDDDDLCAKCLEGVILVLKQQCVECYKVSAMGKTCVGCRRKTSLDYCLIGAHYEDGAIKEALHTFKYEGRIGLSRPLTGVLTKNNSVVSDIDDFKSIYSGRLLITAMPLHWKRRWWRGFNQSAILARVLAKKFDVKYVSGLVKRRRATGTQAALNRAGRLANLNNAFVSSKVTGKVVILVDDILTTGATMHACAGALKAGGARAVIGLAVAGVR